ncbi:MAG: DUF2007 domain-containing protein [Sedimentisphaerales bacterium]|nr:DUF2007 domain-containing protein [Sedimentisphaerales bacterium]
MADKLVTVAEYTDSIKAEMAKQLLEDFGIRAVVLDQNVANLCFISPLTAKLQVLESDAARAAEVLESSEMEYNIDEPEETEGLDEQEEQGEQKEL